MKSPGKGELVVGCKRGEPEFIAGAWQECTFERYRAALNEGNPALITQDERGERRYWLRFQTSKGVAK